MTISYDADADCLYVTLEQGACDATYLANRKGQIIHFNKVTRLVSGVTIQMFSRRAKEGDIEIDEFVEDKQICHCGSECHELEHT